LEFNQILYLKTPIGTVKIIGNENGISSISVVDDNSIRFDSAQHSTVNAQTEIRNCLKECANQLEEYFNSDRKEFDLQLNPQGTEFQKSVWKELQNIPFGKTRSYLEQAKQLGNTKAIRAVASANGKNPLWIVIPCHRIIGSDGSFTGYAGGIWRKKWLLDHESGLTQQSLF
jgi:methylated-DNA-[protein]-cysteine S-methyltransferase